MPKNNFTVFTADIQLKLPDVADVTAKLGKISTAFNDFANKAQYSVSSIYSAVESTISSMDELNTALSNFTGGKDAAKITKELVDETERLGRELRGATVANEEWREAYNRLQDSIGNEVNAALDKQARKFEKRIESIPKVTHTATKEASDDFKELTGVVSSLAQGLEQVSGTVTKLSKKVRLSQQGSPLRQFQVEDVNKARDVAKELVTTRTFASPEEFEAEWAQILGVTKRYTKNLVLEMSRMDAVSGKIWESMRTGGITSMEDLKYRLVGDPIVTDMADDVSSEFSRMHGESAGQFEGLKNDAVNAAKDMQAKLGSITSNIPLGGLATFGIAAGGVIAGRAGVQQQLGQQYLNIHRGINQEADRIIKNASTTSQAMEHTADITGVWAKKLAETAAGSGKNAKALGALSQRLEEYGGKTRAAAKVMNTFVTGVEKLKTAGNEALSGVTKAALSWAEVGTLTAKDFVRLQRELATVSQEANVLLNQSKLNTDASKAAYKAEQRVLAQAAAEANQFINRLKKAREEIEILKARLLSLDKQIAEAGSTEKGDELKKEKATLEKDLARQQAAATTYVQKYNEMLGHINEAKKKAMAAGVQGIYDVALLDRAALRNIQEATTLASIGTLRGQAGRFGVAAQEGLSAGLQALQKDFTALYFNMEDVFDGSWTAKITSLRNVLFGAGKAGNVFARAMDFASDMLYDESDATNDASYSAELLADNLTQSARRYDTAIADIAQSLKTQTNLPKRLLNDIAQGANRSVKEFSRLTENIRTGSDTWKGQLGNVRAYTRNLVDSIKLLENQEIIDPGVVTRLRDLRENIERTNEQGIKTIVERMRRAETQTRVWKNSIFTLAGVFERFRFQLNGFAKKTVAGISATFLYGFSFIAKFISMWSKGVLGSFRTMYDVAVGHSIIPDMVRAIISWFKYMVSTGGSLAVKLTKVVLSPFTWLRNRVSNIFREMTSSFRFVFDISGLVYAGIDKVRRAFERFKEVNTIVQDTSVTIRGMLTGLQVDSEKALKGYMAFIDEMAQATPFEKIDIMEQVSRLFVFELDPKAWFEPIVNAAAAVGKPMEQFVNALAKLQTQGGSAMGDAARMLAEYGVNVNRVTGWVNAATGEVLSFEEAMRASEDAAYAAASGYEEVSFREARLAEDVGGATLALQAYLIQDAKFATAAEARSKTLSGVLSNITDSTDVLLTAFGEPIWQKITDILLEIFESVQKNSQQMVAWAMIIGNDVVKIISKAWDKLRGFFIQDGPSSWLITVAATIRKLANGDWNGAWSILVNIVKKQLSNLLTILNTYAKGAVKWGVTFVKQIATGMIKAAGTVLRNAVRFVAKTISRFLEAHSPTEEGPLSTIDTWGERLMNVFTGSFAEADLSVLDSVLDKIRDKFTNTDSYKSVRGTVLAAIADINNTGTIQGQTWDKLQSQISSLSVATQDYIKAQLKLKAVSKEVADAEAAGFIPKELQDKLDAAKLLVSIKEDNLNLEEQMASANDAGGSDAESTYKDDYKKQKEFLEKKKKLGLVTNEEYYSQLASIEEQYIDAAIEAGEMSGLEARAKMVKEYESKIAQIRADESRKELEKQYKDELELLKKKHELGLISEEEYTAGLLSAEESYVEGSLSSGVLYGLDSHIAKLKELRDQVNATTQTGELNGFDNAMALLDKRYKLGLVSEAEYLQGKIDLHKQYIEDTVSQYQEAKFKGEALPVDDLEKFVSTHKRIIADLDMQLTDLEYAGQQTGAEFLEGVFGDFADGAEGAMAEIDKLIADAESSMGSVFEEIDLKGQFEELGATISTAFQESFDLDFDGISTDIKGIFQPVIDAATWLNDTGGPLIEKWFGKIGETAGNTASATKGFFYPDGGGGKNVLQIWLQNIVDWAKQWLAGVGAGLVAWLPLLITQWKPVVSSLKTMFSKVAPAVSSSFAPIKVGFEAAIAPFKAIVDRAKERANGLKRLAVYTGNASAQVQILNKAEQRLAAVTGNSAKEVLVATNKIGKFELAVTTAKEAVATLIRSVGAFGKSILKLFSWSTVLWTVVIVGIVKNKDKLVALFNDMVGLAGDAVTKILRLFGGGEGGEGGFGGLFTLVKNIFGGVFGYIVNVFGSIGDLFDQGLFEPIGTFFGGFIDIISASMKQLYGVFDLIIGVAAILTGNWDLAKDSFKSAYETYKSGIGDFINSQTQIFASFVDLVPRLFLSLVATIADIFGATAFADWLRDIRTNVSEGILTFFDTVTVKIKEFVTKIVEKAGLFTTLKNIFDNLTDKFAEIRTKLAEPLAKLGEAFNRLKILFIDIWDELKPVLYELGAKLYEIVGPLWEALKPVLQKLGTLLAALPLGLIAATIGAILLPALGLLFGLLTSLAYALENFIDGIVRMLDGITTMFSGIIEVFTGFIDLAVSIVRGDGRGVIDAFWEIVGGIQDIFSGLGDTIVGLLQVTVWNLVELLWGFVSGFIAPFEAVYDTLVGHSIIPDLARDIIWWVEFFVDTSLGLADKMIDGLIRIFKRLTIDSILDEFTRLKDETITFMKTLHSDLAEILATTWNVLTFGGWDWAAFFGATDWIDSVGGMIKGLISNLLKPLLEKVLMFIIDFVQTKVAALLGNQLKKIVLRLFGILEKPTGTLIQKIIAKIRTIGPKIIAALVENLPRILGFIEEFGPRILKITKVVGKIIPVISFIISLWQSFNRFVLDRTSGIIDGLFTIISGGWDNIKASFYGILSIWSYIFGSKEDADYYLKQFSANLLTGVTEVIFGLTGAIIHAGTLVAQLVVADTIGVLGTVLQVIGSITGIEVVSLAGDILYEMDRILGILPDKALEILDGLKTNINTILDAIDYDLGEFLGILRDAFVMSAQDIWTKFSEKFTELYNWLIPTGSFMDNFVRGALAWVNDLTGRFVEKITTMKATLIRIFKRLTYEVVPVVKEFVLAVISAITGIETAILDLPFFDAGKKLISFLVDGIQSAIPSLSDMADQAAEAVWKYFNFGSPADEGPLSKKIEWESYLADYDGNGIEKQFALVGERIVAVFEEVGKAIVNAIQVAVNPAKQTAIINEAKRVGDTRVQLEKDVTTSLDQHWKNQAQNYEIMSQRMAAADNSRARNAESLRYTELANAYQVNEQIKTVVDNSNIHEVNSNLNRAQQAAASRYTELANAYQTMDSVKNVVDNAYKNITNSATTASNSIVENAKAAAEIQKATMTDVMNHYRNVTSQLMSSWANFVGRLQAGEWQDWRGEWHTADEASPSRSGGGYTLVNGEWVSNKTPQFASGAWNLSKDMLAMVHKGEMIIPADYANQIRANNLNTSSSQVSTVYQFNAGAMTFPNVATKSDATGIMSEIQRQIQIGSLKATTI